MTKSILPFPRGSCASQGLTGSTDPVVTEGINFRKDLAGYTATVEDSVNSTGRPVTLLAVQNDSGAALVLNPSDVRKGVTFDTSAGDFLRKVSGFVGDGEYGLLVDDSYPSDYSVAEYDWFWCVLEGPVQSTPDATGLTTGAPVAFAASGYVTVAAAGDAVIGIADATGSTADTLVYVNHLLGKAYIHA